MSKHQWRFPSCAVPEESGNIRSTDSSKLHGHFQFIRQRTIGDPDDDIFLNRAQQIAAGIGPNDIVLGYSAARP